MKCDLIAPNAEISDSTCNLSFLTQRHYKTIINTLILNNNININ